MTDTLPGWLVELATLCGVVFLLAVAAVVLVAGISALITGAFALARTLRSPKETP